MRDTALCPYESVSVQQHVAASTDGVLWGLVLQDAVSVAETRWAASPCESESHKMGHVETHKTSDEWRIHVNSRQPAQAQKPVWTCKVRCYSITVPQRENLGQTGIKKKQACLIKKASDPHWHQSPQQKLLWHTHSYTQHAFTAWCLGVRSGPGLSGGWKRRTTHPSAKPEGKKRGSGALANTLCSAPVYNSNTKPFIAVQIPFLRTHWSTLITALAAL